MGSKIQNKPWTDLDDKWLLENKKNFTFARCAVKMGRTKKSIEHRYYGLREKAARKSAYKIIEANSKAIKLHEHDLEMQMRKNTNLSCALDDVTESLKRRESVISKQQDTIADLQNELARINASRDVLAKEASSFKPFLFGLFTRKKVWQ
ncbi:MAG: hypothetical protein ACQ9ET_00090 [Nitrosomonadaceae bacterium]